MTRARPDSTTHLHKDIAAINAETKESKTSPRSLANCATRLHKGIELNQSGAFQESKYWLQLNHALFSRTRKSNLRAAFSEFYYALDCSALGEHRLAITTLADAKRLAEKHHLEELSANVDLHLGLNYQLEKDHGSAITYLTTAASQCATLARANPSFVHSHAKALIHLGISLYETKNIMASTQFKEAIKLLDSIKVTAENTQLKALAHYHLGTVYFLAGDMLEASVHITQSRCMYRGLGLKKNENLCALLITICHIKMEHPHLANDELSKIVEIKSDDPTLPFVKTFVTGIVDACIGNSKRGNTHLDRILDMSTRLPKTQVPVAYNIISFLMKNLEIPRGPDYEKIRIILDNIHKAAFELAAETTQSSVAPSCF